VIVAGQGFKDFVVGEVLTSSDVDGFLMQQAVMRFADDGARGSALGTAVGTGVLAEGMLTYNLDTKALEVYDGTAWGPVVTVKEKRIEAFTGSGTWTVPAGVTYAIAHMLGGGGGVARNANNAGDGASSSVAFSSGTVTSNGGIRGRTDSKGTNPVGSAFAGNANTGRGAFAVSSDIGDNSGASASSAGDSTYIVAGAAVTAAASITVTVGAGGAAGSSGAAGGSGYVYIEYYEEV
jgi:hypothetical protein